MRESVRMRFLGTTGASNHCNKGVFAEFILKSAAGGLTNYEGLISAAVSQLPTILSMFT